MPREYKILATIALGAIILGVVLFKFAGKPAVQGPLKERTGAYQLGDAQAPVTVTEFADFQCPACRQAQGYSSQLLNAYPHKIRFVFRNFPLPGHPLAQVSAQAAEAAGAQGKFWEMHDMLYDHQDEWGDLSKNLSRNQAIEIFKGYARQLGLDEEKFSQALESNAASAVINQDMGDGTAAGVNATPQFFVNNTMIVNPSLEEIRAEIEKALAQ